MTNHHIYIVIPVFNKVEFTTRCIQSLLQQSYTHYTIVVVNDGSTDNTATILKTKFPQVVILEGDGNLWWTGATNMGVEYVLKIANLQHDFVLTLNNDLEVNADYLDQLLITYFKHQPCLVGSVSVNIKNPEKIEFLGTLTNLVTGSTRTPLPINQSYSQLAAKHEAIESDVLPGRGTLIPADIFSKVGLFDFKHFPQYAADYDFAVRAKKNGYKLILSVKGCVKSIVESSGLKYIDNPSFAVFFRSLTSIRSPTWYKVRYHYAMKHSPIKFGYFIVSMMRITGSFFRAYLKKVILKR